jgi:hypothetical protein
MIDEPQFLRLRRDTLIDPAIAMVRSFFFVQSVFVGRVTVPVYSGSP